MYATRHAWELVSIAVDVRYDAGDAGRRIIERKITVPGDLTPDQRQSLANIAERTPVTVAIRAGTPITTTFETTA
jgi:putative redox protein